MSSVGLDLFLSAFDLGVCTEKLSENGIRIHSRKFCDISLPQCQVPHSWGVGGKMFGKC